MPKKKAAATKKLKRLSESQIVEYGQQYDELGDEIKALEKKRSEVKEPLVAEFKKRGIKALEAEGVRVNMVEQPMTYYDPIQMKDRIGLKRWKRVRKEEVDKEKLMIEVSEGNIDMEDVDACAKVTYKAPYFSISYLETEE